MVTTGKTQCGVKCDGWKIVVVELVEVGKNAGIAVLSDDGKYT